MICPACNGVRIFTREVYLGGGAIKGRAKFRVCRACDGRGEIEDPAPSRSARIKAALGRAYRWATEHHLELDDLRRVRSDAFFRGFCCGALVLYLLRWAGAAILQAALS